MVSARHAVRASWIYGAAVLLTVGAQAADDQRVQVLPERPSREARADLRVDSNLVLAPVTVTDAKQRVVTGLGREAFRVFDDRVEQRVVHFAEQDAPISVGIVFDASRSMLPKIRQARAAVAEFLRQCNPEDEFFLVTFSDRAQLAAAFTDDAGSIDSTLLNTSAGGRTALVDAVYLALDAMKDAKHSRRALLVVSDGGDNDSRYSEGELRRRLQEANVSIYAMGIYQGGLNVLPEEERGGPQLLTRMAEESGGRHFPVAVLASLEETAARIGRELRNEYLLGYSLEARANDGRYHRVQVKLVGQHNLQVTTRPGYYAPGQ